MLQLFTKTKKKAKAYNEALMVIPMKVMGSLMKPHPEEIAWLCNPDLLPHFRDALKLIGLYSVSRISSIDERVIKGIRRTLLPDSINNMQVYLAFEEWMESAKEKNRDKIENDPGTFYEYMFGRYICDRIMYEYQERNDPYEFSEDFAYQVGVIVFTSIALATPQLEVGGDGGIMKRIFSGVLSIAAIAIVYGVINLVLVGGQKFLYHDDEVKLGELKTELSDTESDINGYEDLLTEIVANLEELEEDINIYESDYPDGIPEEYYENYTSMVTEYNEWLREYENQYDKYISEIDYYNEKVEEANAVAEKIGSTWYVVPIPGGKH